MYEWEEQEIKCEKYLNSNFGDIVTFIRKGGVDSTVPDIKVMKGDCNIFNMEVKRTPSQGGQFVLKYDDEKEMFYYSSKNRLPEIPAATRIIKNINSSIGRKTSREDLPVKLLGVERDAFRYLKYVYLSKNIKYVICDRNVIIPVSRINQYFIVETICSVRRSGTADVGMDNEEIALLVKERFPDCSISCQGTKLFVVGINANLRKTIIQYGKYEYTFVEVKGATFELRKQSNTFAYTVYFQMKLIKGRRGIQNRTFKAILLDELS